MAINKTQRWLLIGLITIMLGGAVPIGKLLLDLGEMREKFNSMSERAADHVDKDEAVQKKIMDKLEEISNSQRAMEEDQQYYRHAFESKFKELDK